VINKRFIGARLDSLASGLISQRKSKRTQKSEIEKERKTLERCEGTTSRAP
jgi:hypothetical protein